MSSTVTPARAWSRLREFLPQRADLQAAKRDPKADLIAGVTVAIVALPLALAFGVSSGMGAQAGFVTAVVAGVVAAVFGGSNLQVSGPTGAMTVVLVPVFHEHGANGVLTVGLLGGLVLVVAAFAKVGRFVRLLPLSVVEGFTAGIAVVIALQQFPAAFGTDGGSHEYTWATAGTVVWNWLHHPLWAPLLMALAVCAVMLVGGRRWPVVPWSLVAVVLATVAAQVFDIPVAGIGELPPGLPWPSASFFEWDRLSGLLPSALAVAALAALESLLCATVADSMTVGERHNPDRELFGQGLANIVTPFFGGVPATAAIARTAVNVRSGARSRTAAVTHAVVLLIVVSALAALVGRIPLAALAGVLFATTIRMVNMGAIKALMKATRGDALVVVLTLAVTVLLTLVDAVAIGLAVAVVLALRAITKSARIEETPLDHADHTDEERALLQQHIVAYRIDGPLFFAAAHRFFTELEEVGDVKAVILRLGRMSTVDATGAQMLYEAIKHLEGRGLVVVASGISAEHAAVFQRMGIAHLRAQGRLFEDTPAAIAYVRSEIGV